MRSAILLLGLMSVSLSAFCQQQPQAKDTTRKPVPSAIVPKGPASKEMQKRRDDKATAVRIDRSRQVADKMADSLGLSQTQRADIININVSLEQQKALAFKTDTSRAGIGKELQLIERQRDRLYKTVLTEKQYGIYEKSKVRLINPQPAKAK